MTKDYDTTIPDWKNMPDSECLLRKSWEDFYPSAQQITQDKWKRDPTPDEISDIFEKCHDMDCENDSYWGRVDATCSSYYQDVCNLCGHMECTCCDDCGETPCSCNEETKS